MRLPPKLAVLLNRATFWEAVRYFFASLAALGVDLGVLFGLREGLGVAVVWAAGAGFVAGLVFIYVVSIRKVFLYRRLEGTVAAEFAWFWITGLIGLGFTAALMPYFVSTVGLSLLVAKIVTSGFVFTFNYLSRKVLLFTDWASVHREAELGEAVDDDR